MIYEVEIGTCEYCQAEKVLVCSTPEKETLCEDCHKLTIKNCKDAIQSIKNCKKKSKTKMQQETPEELKRKANEAILKMTNGQYDLNGKIK